MTHTAEPCQFEQVIVCIAFVILLVGETQGDSVAVATGALAVLGDPSAEARHAAAVHTEVTVGTIT